MISRPQILRALRPVREKEFLFRQPMQRQILQSQVSPWNQKATHFNNYNLIEKQAALLKAASIAHGRLWTAAPGHAWKYDAWASRSKEPVLFIPKKLH